MYTQDIPPPSVDEIELATRMLATAHCADAGVLNAQAAIDIFGRSGLSFEQLRDIWNIVDQSQNGELSINELVAAIRLMGWAQAGKPLHADLLRTTGPLPTLDGINDVRKPEKHIQFPPIAPEALHGFRKEFFRAGPVSGVLDGDKAMSAFMAASALSYDQLFAIAKLADNDARGVFDLSQFSLAMYLIHAFQSCLIPSIPNTIPKSLRNKFTDVSLGEVGSPNLSAQHSTPSLSPQAPQRVTPPSSSSNTPLLGVNINDADEQPWAILPHEKSEAEKEFVQLDTDGNGYIGTDVAAKFLMRYNLPPNELGRIWMLADVKRDNRLTQDEFVVLLHILRQRLAGEPLPDTLPSSLIPPSLRLQFMPSPPIGFPALQKAKPPPPPPPKKDHLLNGRLSRAHTLSMISTSPTISSRYSNPLSSPLSPPSFMHRQSISIPLSSPQTSTLASYTRTAPSTPLLSPFDDPSIERKTNALSREPTPPPPLPQSPPRNDQAALNSLEQTHKKEVARLKLVIESLRAQISEYGDLREVNTNLTQENGTLKSELRDMERTVSEVLSANDRLGSQEQYVSEISRLTAEVEAKETEASSAKRVLDVLKREEQELRVSLREALAAAATAKAETEEVCSTLATQKDEIQELSGRLADMSRAMSEPSSQTNNRELRVLLRDAAKENDSLKKRLREMEKSMEQMLLSGRSTTQLDDLQRENRRLKEQIQEMTVIAMTVQKSSTPADSENLTRENQQLKDQIKEGQRGVAEIRQTHAAKIVEMQQQIDSLTHENRLLKIDANSRQQRSAVQEDNNVPPPAYDDSFVIPP